MKRTLVTTEKCLREILKFPTSVWYLLINQQDCIVVSTNAANNEMDLGSIHQRLHNKQIKIIPQSNIVNELPNNPTFLAGLSDCLFLLDISKAKADEVSRNYGVCCMSTEEYAPLFQPPYVTNKGRKVRTDDINPSKIKSWDYFYKGINRNCTSAIIIDRFLFNKEWNKERKCDIGTEEDCRFNLRSIMNNIIPVEIFDNQFVLTIIFNHEGAKKDVIRNSDGQIERDSDGKVQNIYYTFAEFVELIEQVKIEVNRPFQYDIEVISVNNTCYCYNETHDRYVITNFHITIAPHKLVTYTQDQKYLYAQTLIFDYIYSDGIEINDISSVPIATKESVLRSMSKLMRESKEVSLMYAINGNITAFNKNKIRNRLLQDYLNE